MCRVPFRALVCDRGTDPGKWNHKKTLDSVVWKGLEMLSRGRIIRILPAKLLAELEGMVLAGLYTPSSAARPLCQEARTLLATLPEGLNENLAHIRRCHGSSRDGILATAVHGPSAPPWGRSRATGPINSLLGAMVCRSERTPYPVAAHYVATNRSASAGSIGTVLVLIQ
jgi:hypothetical protein